MKLPAEDVSDLRTCRVGDCSVKLSEQAINAFRTQVDWKAAGASAAADTLMRRLALEYVTGYLAGGNARLAVYRDKSRPTVVADEFRAMVGQVPDLTTEMPMLRRYLLEYPTFANQRGDFVDAEPRAGNEDHVAVIIRARRPPKRLRAAELPALTLHAVALHLISLYQRRELCLEGVLCGMDLAERAGDLLLLQLVLDCEGQCRESLEVPP